MVVSVRLSVRRTLVADSRVQIDFQCALFLVLRHLPGSGCIEALIQFHGTSESHGERA